MAVFFTSALIASPVMPLTHARIGWHTLLTSTNFTATAAEAGYPAINMLNPATFERYRPTVSPAVIDIDLLTAKDVDYMAIQTKNATNIKLEYSSDGIIYTTVLDEATLDKTTMFLFTNLKYRHWKITITGASLQVAALKLGLVLEMYRPIYGNVTPMPLNRVTAVRPNLSETGQLLGASQKRIGVNSSYEWRHLPADWYRINFDMFVQTNPRIAPFFIAWRPSTFTEDVNYAWTTADVKPSNMGVRDFMSVGITVEGFIDAV